MSLFRTTSILVGVALGMALVGLGSMIWAVAGGGLGWPFGVAMVLLVASACLGKYIEQKLLPKMKAEADAERAEWEEGEL